MDSYDRFYLTANGEVSDTNYIEILEMNSVPGQGTFGVMRFALSNETFEGCFQGQGGNYVARLGDTTGDSFDITIEAFRRDGEPTNLYLGVRDSTGDVAEFVLDETRDQRSSGYSVDSLRVVVCLPQMEI